MGLNDTFTVVLDARATTRHFPGISRATLGLLTGLQQVEHNHRFAVLGYGTAPPQEHQIFNDPRFAWIGTHAGPLSLAQQWQLPLLARIIRPAVWHAPYYVRPLVGVPRPIVTVFDVIGRVVPGALSWRGRLLFELMMRLSLKGAAHVITSSEATRRDLVSLYSVAPDRIAVISLAVDDQYRPQPSSIVAHVRSYYALPESYLLYLGSNKPHKNLPALIAAFQRVQTDASLVIAGRWDARFDQPKQMVQRYGLAERVRFLHDVAEENVPALLSGAIAFVFPSLYEGFGLPPLEAMACGTPVIASNRSSLPEVVGDAGLLVPPQPVALADAIQRLLDDRVLRDRLRERGLARAQDFSWQHTARQTLQVYESVASQRSQ